MRLSEALILDAEFWASNTFNEEADTAIMEAEMDDAVDMAVTEYVDVGLFPAFATRDVLSWFSLLIAADVASHE